MCQHKLCEILCFANAEAIFVLHWMAKPSGRNMQSSLGTTSANGVLSWISMKSTTTIAHTPLEFVRNFQLLVGLCHSFMSRLIVRIFMNTMVPIYFGSDVSFCAKIEVLIDTSLPKKTKPWSPYPMSELKLTRPGCEHDSATDAWMSIPLIKNTCQISLWQLNTRLVSATISPTSKSNDSANDKPPWTAPTKAQCVFVGDSDIDRKLSCFGCRLLATHVAIHGTRHTPTF